MFVAQAPSPSASRITSSFVRNIRKGMLETNIQASKTETLQHVLRLIKEDRYEDAMNLASSHGLDLQSMHRDFRAAMADHHRTVATALFCTKYGLGRGWLRESRPEAA